MDYGLRLALTHHWWAWDHAEIRDAVYLAVFGDFVRDVKEALKRNRGTHSAPDSLEVLAGREFLRRNSVHTARAFGEGKGKRRPTIQFLTGVSTSLKIPMDRIVPTTQVIIANTTLQLCGPDVSNEDALRYAQYRWELTSSDGPHPCPDTVRRVATRLQAPGGDTAAIAAKIMSVARALGPHLVRIDMELAGGSDDDGEA